MDGGHVGEVSADGAVALPGVLVEELADRAAAGQQTLCATQCAKLEIQELNALADTSILSEVRTSSNSKQQRMTDLIEAGVAGGQPLAHKRRVAQLDVVLIIPPIHVNLRALDSQRVGLQPLHADGLDPHHLCS